MTRRAAPTVYLLSETVNGLGHMLFATIFSVYLVERVGLSPFRLVLLGTVLEVTVLVFEVPTGVVADLVSRRLSVQLGWFVEGAGFVLLGLSDSFPLVVGSQVLWGIGATFVSGADVAWITDEVGEEAARPLYLRAAQRWYAGALVGIVVSAGLATVSLGLPIVLGGLTYVGFSLVLIVIMPEDHFHRHVRGDEETRAGRFRRRAADGRRAVRAHPALLLIFAVALLHGASSEGFDRLFTLHLLRGIGLPRFAGLDPVLWIGALEAAGLLLSVAATEVVKRRADLTGHVAVARLLFGIDVVVIGGVVVFGLTGGFAVAAAALLVVSMLREVRDTFFTAWLNQGLDPATRATVNSMGAFADAVGQAAGGPVLGVVAMIRGVGAAIVASGVMGSPALALYVRAIRRGSVGTARPEEMEELEIDEV